MDDRTLHQLIANTARKLWEDAGRPEGADKAHWFEAVRQVSRMTTLPMVTSPSEAEEVPFSENANTVGKPPTLTD